jgi:hypothetical protein
MSTPLLRVMVSMVVSSGGCGGENRMGLSRAVVSGVE